MKKFLVAALSAIAVSIGNAHADQLEGAYVGAQAGYHDLYGAAANRAAGVIFGGYGGYNISAGGDVIVGVEGNFNVGTIDITWEGGANAHIGLRVGSDSMLFLRAGLHWVRVDIDSPFRDVLGLNFVETVDSSIFGIGGQFGIGENLSARVVVDSVSFDSVRATAGIGLHF